LAFEEKQKQNDELSHKIDDLLSDFAKITSENTQMKFELSALKNQLENYRNLIFLNKNSSGILENNLKDQIEKQGLFFTNSY